MIKRILTITLILIPVLSFGHSTYTVSSIDINSITCPGGINATDVFFSEKSALKVEKRKDKVFFELEDCTEGQSIKNDVSELMDEIIEAYVSGSDVSEKAITLLGIIGSTNSGNIIRTYSKLDDREYLKSIAPAVKSLATYEVTRLYYECLYQELIPVLQNISAEAGQNAGAYGANLITNIKMLIEEIEKNYGNYNRDFSEAVKPVYDSLAFYEKLRRESPNYNTLIRAVETKK